MSLDPRMLLETFSSLYLLLSSVLNPMSCEMYHELYYGERPNGWKWEKMKLSWKVLKAVTCSAVCDSLRYFLQFNSYDNYVCSLLCHSIMSDSLCSAKESRWERERRKCEQQQRRRNTEIMCTLFFIEFLTLRLSFRLTNLSNRYWLTVTYCSQFKA